MIQMLDPPVVIMLRLEIQIWMLFLISNCLRSEDQNKQRKGNENSLDEKDAPNVLPSPESYRSMGEILSSMDPGNHLPVPGSVESGSGKQTGKASSTNFNSKWSSFWGRSSVSCYFFAIYFLITLDNSIYRLGNFWHETFMWHWQYTCYELAIKICWLNMWFYFHCGKQNWYFLCSFRSCVSNFNVWHLIIFFWFMQPRKSPSVESVDSSGEEE